MTKRETGLLQPPSVKISFNPRQDYWDSPTNGLFVF